jgi:hypothetical protein
LVQLLRIVFRSGVFLKFMLNVANRVLVDALCLFDKFTAGLLIALDIGVERLLGYFARTII